MELHGLHKPFHRSLRGEEQHQMLDLNRRLETYLSRVKLLEEENAALAREIQTLRRSDRGASARRKGLEDELRRARLAVDAAWRDRVQAEVDVCRVTEELQVLDLQRQGEARARAEAREKMEQSKKELEEEQRAQVWLREKVAQLEREMTILVQTHQEDVVHAEATRRVAAPPPTLPPRGEETESLLLLLAEEYSQRAARAWRDAADAYQEQLDRLQESVDEAGDRLRLARQEKTESRQKIRELEEEVASARDVRTRLETSAARHGDKYRQEIQQLQEHFEGLEAEKEEVGQHIDHLLLENRGLLQQKTSLGLEVATYRALLDSESLRGDISLLNQPRNITDAVFSPWGVKKNYQIQLSASHKTTSLSSVRGTTGRGQTSITATPMWSRKPVTCTETPKLSKKCAHEDKTKSAPWETPYPKILQDGAVESFRPQEVHEKVTYAEPLSPPNEQEAETTSGDKEEDWNNVGVERPIIESVASCQVESGLSTEPPLNDEVDQHPFTTPNLTPYHVRMTEEPSGFSDDSDKDTSFEIPAEKEDMQELHAPIDAWVDKEWRGKEVEQEDTSDSETEAVLEPNFDSRTSSPVSECEPEEMAFDFSPDENILKEDAAQISQEMCQGIKEADVEDKLYPDGEEMDTWDSVIERKVALKMDAGIRMHEEKRQHAEPEEDISPKEQEKKEMRQDFATHAQQDDNNMASSMTGTQVDFETSDQEHARFPDNEEDEDSQNVSVSWRTELESDSYAQDNTLADTRPLIRYKSDETDANAQASHMDESESSDGEQEKKAGEMGTWSEGKSKRFGTMEDLCEEVEGELLDEEYNLRYAHIWDRDVGHGMTVSKHAEEMVGKVSGGYSDEETEELAKPTVPISADYDEELETDRLVEQELEDLATDSYSACFAQQQVRDSEDTLRREMTKEKEAGLSSCAEPEVKVNHQLASAIAIIDQHYENLHFSGSSVPQADALADEEVHHKDQEAIDASEKIEEEDEHNASMVTNVDVAEDHSGFTDFISRPDMEEILEDPKSVLQVKADEENLQDVVVPTKVKEVAPVEAPSTSQEHLIEDVADRQEFPEVPEWEVLENPSEDFEIRDQKEGCDNVPQSTESYLHDDGGSDEGIMMSKEEPLEISPDSVPDENDIFVVKDSKEHLNTNGKDNSLHGFYTNDFWVSSLETGATYQPDDACNEAAEQTNQNQGFADNLVWGNSENVVNWNSRVDIDSSKALGAKKEQEQMHSEVKQVLCRNVAEGELVHSDESEVEGESWSSGEEPV